MMTCRILVLTTVCLAVAAVSGAQAVIETSGEARFQLDFHVPDAALGALLPQGFTPNVAAQGPAKDANIRVIFVDRMTVNGADGKPVGKGSSRFVYLAAPVKDPGGANAQVVISGLTDDGADAPGPFGVYLPAKTHRIERSTTSSGTGPTIDKQDWMFEAASGEHLEVHLEYEHGVGNKGNPGEGKFYSAKNPAMLQIWRQEQVLDILRNATTNPPDHVRKYSFKGGGGSYAKLFDGTERTLSWDNIVWVTRTVLQP